MACATWIDGVIYFGGRKKAGMIPDLPEIAIPTWLTGLSISEIKDGPFPLDNLLQDSLYYPSSGFDGDPVKYLAGDILSFIYVDYGNTCDEYLSALKAGFRGYDLVATRSVKELELTPRGWDPTPPPDLEGDPSRYRHAMKQPYCFWSVFQRGEGIASDHGPIRFSLLYLCADGVAAFQALYIANAAAPKAVAIVQPGHGFGLNWTNFENPQGPLARAVFGNPRGQPEILLHGGYGPRNFYRKPCWPSYSKHVCFVPKGGGNGSIGIWKREASDKPY